MKILDSGGKQITRVLKKCELQGLLESINSEIEQNFRIFFEPLLPIFEARSKINSQFWDLPIEQRKAYRSIGEVEEKYFRKKNPQYYAVLSSALGHSEFLQSLSAFFEKFLKDDLETDTLKTKKKQVAERPEKERPNQLKSEPSFLEADTSKANEEQATEKSQKEEPNQVKSKIDLNPNQERVERKRTFIKTKRFWKWYFLFMGLAVILTIIVLAIIDPVPKP